jgi:glycosyltransferase involved in cell wall biosynthesis
MTSSPAPDLSCSHLVLIPSYNTGALLTPTVQAALANWSPVWVVLDGSTDASESALADLAAQPGIGTRLRILVQPVNAGKGAAVLAGLDAAQAAGYSHVFTMDADGQHPAPLIGDFMRASQTEPAAMILGKPVFDASAPALRVNGRKVSNGWANLETLWAGIGDSLYGFRVYPIAPLQHVMRGQRWMRRFDFDPEAVVRLCWAGVTPRNIDAPVRYISKADGGVSHFNYLRDNTLLTWMHTRLMIGFALRLPSLLWRRLRGHAPF